MNDSWFKTQLLIQKWVECYQLLFWIWKGFIVLVNWLFPFPTFPPFPSHLHVLFCLLSVKLDSISASCYNVDWWFVLVQVCAGKCRHVQVCAMCRWPQLQWVHEICDHVIVQKTLFELISLLNCLNCLLSLTDYITSLCLKSFSVLFIYFLKRWEFI